MGENRRALFISHCVPYPPDKGERVRAFNEIKALSGRFRITLAAMARNREELAEADALTEWCENVLVARTGGMGQGAFSLLFRRSVTEGFFRSAKLAAMIRRQVRAGAFDLVFGTCSGVLPYVLSVPASARVMDLVDADSAKWSAYAGKASWPMSWLYRRESKAIARLERRALTGCDAVCLVSDAEAGILGGGGGKLLAVGNGVDLDYFQPRDRSAETASLVFTGTMSYRPNVEGVCWFAREVWPELRRKTPDLEFHVVGRDPDAAVAELARLPGVRVTGSVPDVRPYLAKAAVAVCPLQTARGVQNKILEAMAMGKAVVASPQAAEGLDVGIGSEVLCAQTPEQWRDAVSSLLNSVGLRARLGDAARKRVEMSYDWSARLAPLVTLCETLAGAMTVAHGEAKTALGGAGSQ